MPPVTNVLQTPLSVFLDAHRVEKGAPYSFTGMGVMKGNFMVSDEDYPHFLDLLHEYLYTQQRRPLNLVEQRRCDNHTPLLIDLDFRYPAERALQRQFEIDDVRTFLAAYVQNISHFYQVDHGILRFFVTLRPAPYEDKKSKAIKDGVHIECPDLVLPAEHQQVLRHRCLEQAALQAAFQHTGYVNPEKDIFDESVVKKNGWFFYGESKPDIPAYQLEAVYAYDCATGMLEEEVGAAELYTSRQLLELLSIRHELRRGVPPLHPEAEEEWRTRLDYCTGRRVAFTPAMDEEDEDTGATAAMNVIHVTSSNTYEQFEKDKIDLAKQLARECLSADRATGYQSWMEVGWCLHNIDPSHEMFAVWMEFSQKSHKAGENNEAQLEREWNKWHRSQVGEQRAFTVRSLHMWAKADSPKRYREIMSESFTQFVEAEVEATHTHIARLMKRMYGDRYASSVDSKKVEWFEFTGSSWKKLPQGIDLRNKLATEVAQVIIDARTSIRRRLIAENADDEYISRRMKEMMRIESSLYQSGFKDSVMKDCIGLFYEEDFAQKMNANQYLIGFANGVVDLHAPTGEAGSQQYTVLFRKAEPSDFITFMAGRYATKNCDPIDYVPYDPHDPEQAPIHAGIDDFMAKIFPRPELRAYMWRKLASCLEGANKEQTYETWIGVGGNGKSKLVDLMSMTLGDYASSLQSTAMTRKRPESGAANPDIMAIRNKRFIYMAEPDDREPLNTSRMKQFTGEDDVEARGLFEDQTKFKITGKIFMLCNAFPAINTMDRGTWRRVRAVPFEAKFVDTGVEDADPSKNIHPRDNDLDKKLKEWRTLFMSRLVHIYKTEYLPNGLGKVPAIVTQESNKYQESFDSVAKFMNARIREISKGGYEAAIKDIFRVYKNWFESVGGGVGRKLNQTDLYKRLCDKCGEPADKKTFKQLRLFEDDEQLEEYEQGLREATQ
jgi:P4 family phage/plasmid primase-like protien